jgi:hypothetical protein
MPGVAPDTARRGSNNLIEAINDALVDENSARLIALCSEYAGTKTPVDGFVDMTEVMEQLGDHYVQWGDLRAEADKQLTSILGKSTNFEKEALAAPLRAFWFLTDTQHGMGWRLREGAYRKSLQHEFNQCGRLLVPVGNGQWHFANPAAFQENVTRTYRYAAANYITDVLYRRQDDAFNMINRKMPSEIQVIAQRLFDWIGGGLAHHEMADRLKLEMEQVRS